MNPTPRADTSGQARQRWKLSGALLLLGAAVWFLHATFKSDIPTPNVKPFASLGGLAADETVALMGTHGSIAIVSEIPDPKSPASDAMVRSIGVVAVEVQAFKETLRRRGRYTILSELKLVRPADAINTAWPSDSFRKLLQSVPNHATLVAFCSLPSQLTPAERALLQSRTGRLIIVGGVVPEVKPLVDGRVAHLAISARVPTPQQESNEVETPQAWVRRVYAVLKP